MTKKPVKKNEVAVIPTENIESKFEMKLSQTDLIECAVSEKEEQCYAALDEIKKEIDAANKSLKDCKNAITKEADSIADEKYKDLLNDAEKALKTVDKNIKITYLVDMIVPDKGVIKCAVKISRQSENVSNRDAGLTLYNNSEMKFNSTLKGLVKEQSDIEDQIRKLRDEEYEISEKLGNIDRLLRQAKAAITRNAIKGTNLDNMVPQLPNGIRKKD